MNFTGAAGLKAGGGRYSLDTAIHCPAGFRSINHET